MSVLHNILANLKQYDAGNCGEYGILLQKETLDEVTFEIDAEVKKLDNDLILYYDEMMVRVMFDDEIETTLVVYDTYIKDLNKNIKIQNNKTQFVYNPYNVTVIYRETFTNKPKLLPITDHVMDIDVTWNWADEIIKVIAVVQIHRVPEKYGYLPSYTPINLANC